MSSLSIEPHRQVILFDSPMKSGNMEASKQLSNELETKIDQHRSLVEGLKSSYCRWCYCVSFNNAQEEAVWDSDADEAFSESLEQTHLGASCMTAR